MTNLLSHTKVGYTYLYRTFRTPYWRIPLGIVAAYLWLMVFAFFWGFFLVFVGVYWALVPSAILTLGVPVVIGWGVNQRETTRQEQGESENER